MRNAVERRMGLHRTQIWLEPDQYRALLEVARTERRSLSDVVRRVVERELRRRRREPGDPSARRADWLRRARLLRADIAARRGGPIAVAPDQILHQIRDERDEQLLDGIPRASNGGD